MHFWSFWAKYCHFLYILSNARPKNKVNRVPRLVFRYVGNKTFDFSSFGQFGPGHAGLFGALLMGRLAVVARGLYLARHLFTLWLLEHLRCKKGGFVVYVRNQKWKKVAFEGCGVGGQTLNGKSLNLFFPYFLDEFPKRQSINSNPISGLSENAFHCLKSWVVKKLL